MKTWADLLLHRAAAQSTRTAFRFLPDGGTTETTITYGELDLRARSIAAELQARLPARGQGERVLLLYPPGIDYIAGLFGCFYAGAIAVPAYPPQFNRPWSRITGLAADCSAIAALTTSAIADHVAADADARLNVFAGGGSWIATDTQTPYDASSWRHAGARPEDVAFLQYTSGSTSSPKGVVLSHANLIENSESIRRATGNSAEGVSVTWLPPYHDMGLIGCLLQAVYVGQEAIVMSPLTFLRRPLRWLQAISRYRGTISGGPNFAYDLCVRRIPEAQRASLDLSSWQTAFNGAERVRSETIDRFCRAFDVASFRRSSFTPCYGLAEASLCVSVTAKDAEPVEHSPNPAHEVSDEAPSSGVRGTLALPARSFVACGSVAPGVEVRIVDPSTKVACALGDVGEVWVRGGNVGLGYWNKPEATESTFHAEIDGESGTPWLRTGDLGFFRDGQLSITGRLKDLVILLGRNHYPEDIERTAEKAHPALRSSCGAAFAVEIDGTERLVVVYDADNDVPWSIDEVGTRVREAIAEEHDLQLHALVMVKGGGVPKTSSGKVQRRSTREMFVQGTLSEISRSALALELSTPAAAGKTSSSEDTLRSAIARTMAAVLDVEEVGLHEDFFALGGHSLMATQLTSRLRESLGVDVPLRMLFEAPTVAALADRVAQLLPDAAVSPIVRAPAGGPTALSYSQERMWFVHQMAPESSAYNIAGALVARGALDVAAMDRALREVARRHAVLRTTYDVRDGHPVPRVRGEDVFRVDVVDLRARPQNAEQVAMHLGSELARRPFDLACDIPFRAAVYRIESDHAVIALSIHHIAADGWSMSILLREALDIYASFVSGKSSPLAEPDLQYADYSHWQRAHLGGDSLREQEAYWEKALAGLPDFVGFPTDHPRPAQQTYKGAMEPLELPGDLSQSIRELAGRHGVTPFMVLFAAFNVLLHRHSHQTDIPVGVPIANRNWLASERFIGTLVNTLVLRSDLSENPSFSLLLKRVRETSLSAYAHQDVPFERVVELLQPTRTKGQSPLFQVMFDVQSIDLPAGEVAGIRLKPARLHRGGSQFDLTFSIADVGAGHLGAVEYATSLFEPETIRRLIAEYVTVLESVVLDPSQRISAIPLLGAAERATLLETWNATETPYDRFAYVHRQFETHAAEHPESIAVRFEGTSVTYAALNRAANRVAHRLLAAGAGRGALVGVCLDRSPVMLAALLGTLKAGAAYVPIDPLYPQERIAMILEDAKPRVILADATSRSKFVSDATVVDVDDAFRTQGAPARETSNPTVTIDPESRAYVLFTSGSTGRPKGVQIPHRALVSFLGSMRKEPGMTPGDRMMAVTTISFDIAGLELYLPLVVGASIDLVSREVAGDPSLLREAFERARPTVMQATPSTWRMLIDAGFRGTGELKALCGGEALPADLAAAILERAASLWNLYGPTETTIWSTCQAMTKDAKITIGRPIDNTQIYLLDENLQPVPMGVQGEIFIGGDGVAIGYLGRDDLTAERFLANPFVTSPRRAPHGSTPPYPTTRSTTPQVPMMYRTGDAARYRHDGTIEYLGRLDGQVKLRGHRIELGEIESALRRHTSVGEVAVSVYAKSAGDQRLVAYVIPADGKDLVPSDLRAHLRASLPDYMVPGVYVPLERLPFTPNGKLDRKALPAPFETRTTDDVERGRSPQGVIEQALARIWEETLGVSPIAATDDFFALGGHSLVAVRLFAKIREEMRLDLPLRVLFEATTIEAMARLVPSESSTSLVSSGPDGVVAIQPRGSRTPIFWVDALGVGGGGGLLRYRRLAQLLGADQPSYGLLEPPHAHESIESWAAYCIESMKTVQPEGPYYLAGYCLGGNLAYEMARQLRAAGEEVAMVALLESRTSLATMPENESRWERLMATYRSTSKFVSRLAVAGLDDQLGFARYALRKLGREALARVRSSVGIEVKSDPEEEMVDLRHYSEEYLPIARHHWELLMNHVWASYSGRVHLFRVPRRGIRPRLPALGWERIAKDVVVDVIPGWHEKILEEPYVGELATRFAARLPESHVEAEDAIELPAPLARKSA